MIASIAVLVAAAGTVIAMFARRDAKQSAQASRDSASSAKRSADAAENVAVIERQRHHHELTPRLSVAATCPGPGTERIRLTVGFDADNPLDRLDHLKIRVRDDDPDRRPMVAGGPTQEQLDDTIWGPYRFVPGIDDADALGRAVPGRPLARGESRVVSMEPSLAPEWTTTIAPTSGWRRDYAGKPIRLEITCTRDGELPWVLTYEVEPPRPRFSASVSRSGRQLKVTVTNEGTSHARDVTFSRSAEEMIHAEQVPILEPGRSSTATVVLTAQGARAVELTWFDRLGVHGRQTIDLNQ